VPRGTSEVVVGQTVRKSGRTSGTNQGEVKVVHATIRVSMGEIGSAVFTDQVLTTSMAQPGDSGSVVVDEYNRVCECMRGPWCKILEKGFLDRLPKPTLC